MGNSYLVFEFERDGVLCEEVAHRRLETLSKHDGDGSENVI